MSTTAANYSDSTTELRADSNSDEQQEVKFAGFAEPEVIPGESEIYDSTCSSRSLLCAPWRLFKKFRNAGIVTVEPALFLFFFGYVIYGSIHQQYYYQRYGLQLLENTSFPFPNDSFCLNSSMVDQYAGNGTHRQVESFSVRLVLFAQLANQIPAVLVTILTGPLSDKFGRKPGIIAVGIGKTLQAAITVAIVHFQLNPYYFILANFFSGIFGGQPAIMGGSYAYLADISTQKWRSLRFGILEASMASGALLGQFLGGFWLKSINCNFMPLMWMNLATNAAIIVYGLFYLPESLSREERKVAAAKNSKGFRAMLTGLKMFCGRLPNYSGAVVWKLWVSILVTCLVLINTLGWGYINVFFLKEFPFDFDPRQIGIYEGVNSSSGIVATTLVLGLLIVLKAPDAAIAIIGLLFSCACNLLTGLSRRGYQVYIISAFQGVGTITWAGLRGYASKLVMVEDQGAFFAVASASEAVTSVIAGVIWPSVFDEADKHDHPGITYIVMAAISFMALPMALMLLVFGRRKNSQEDSMGSPPCCKVTPSLHNSVCGDNNVSNDDKDENSITEKSLLINS